MLIFPEFWPTLENFKKVPNSSAEACVAISFTSCLQNIASEIIFALYFIYSLFHLNKGRI
jgi:hypothetical protein